MADSLLTVSYLANIGCVEGIDSGQFNACEVWVPYTVESAGNIHMRLCDRDKPRRWAIKDIPETMHWAWAYDSEAGSDGIELEIVLPVSIMKMPTDDVHRLIARHLPVCECA